MCRSKCGSNTYIVVYFNKRLSRVLSRTRSGLNDSGYYLGNCEIRYISVFRRLFDESESHSGAIGVE